MTKAVYVRCYGDWEGVYVDGKLIDQNHNLRPRKWLQLAVEHDIDEYETIRDVALQEDYGRASLPQDFEELDE